ncbi:hypothetical protein MTR_4g084760 [Medicago truncatula]|uniref:Reverse transcriptase zinc-binding domain-containing protein n=1 Tax=Medicago truncatula TaxID=3880 RepID=A0A072UMI9_MEDTR|nr:hypothetical protein MTR_4g084760 [Medicago truncatula]
MDKATWRLEKNGLYSVCSGAYREIINNNDAMLQHRVPGNWNENWNLKLPPKIKNFMWRICRNCLPTPMRLLTKESALQLVPYVTTMGKMVNTCSSSEAKVLDAGSGWDFGFQFNSHPLEHMETQKQQGVEQYCRNNPQIGDQVVAFLNSWKNAQETRIHNSPVN